MTAKQLPLIYLASASPRRRELLTQIGIPFELLDVDVPEIQEEGESPELYCLRVALAKASAGRAATTDTKPVLGADTTVALDEKALGKPESAEQAVAMLQQLAGTTHEVYTAVCVVDEHGEAQSRLSVSHVTFRDIGENEIRRYVDTGEPMDKAGSYAIQGFGAVFVERLEGSYSGVMGLPLFETAELLHQLGIVPPWPGNETR